MSSTPLRRSKRIQENTPLKKTRFDAKEDHYDPIQEESYDEDDHQTSEPKKKTKCFSLMEAPSFMIPYLAKDPSKRDGEWFFIWYSVAWILAFGCVVVSEIYQHVEDLGYWIIGLSVCVPCFLIPLLFPSQHDRQLLWHQRYVMKANVWIAAFNFVGNYFWTHYFFNLLGASYSFPIKYLLNKIPPICFLMTQPYFLTYHSISNLILRAVRKTRSLKLFKTIVAVFVISVVWSYLETWSIQMVPYYSFVDRDRMYTVGTFFYSLYFFVSFPMFLRLDESRKWSISRALIDSLASAMIVFILCDFWRLLVGAIIPMKANANIPYGAE